LEYPVAEEFRRVLLSQLKSHREYGYAIKKSGRWLTTEPFFIAILFSQYKTIRSLEEEAERLNKLRRKGNTST